MEDAPAPFLKWAGGKRRLVPFIAERLLPEEGAEAMRLVEPFAGGAAVGLALARRFRRLWLNDVNGDVINVYTRLRDDPADYVRRAAELFTPETNDPETYYRLRDAFNGSRDPEERAALFLYLNRHGYNGLCRYNRTGAFNVPFGRYARPYFPESELWAAAEALQGAELTTDDFESVLAACGPGDVVYCDPPYAPLNATSSFTDYAAGGFGMADHERLAAAARAAAERGALVAISNHATPATKSLYPGAKLYPRQVRRTISCDGENRREVAELLAVYRPASRRDGGRDRRRSSLLPSPARARGRMS